MKWFERIKTLLFIGLFVSAVTMAGIYIAAQPRAEATDLPTGVLSALRGGTGSDAARPVRSQLQPTFLGIKVKGASAVGLCINAAMLGDLNDALAPWVAFALGDGARAETLVGEEAEQLWQSCLTADAYFYLSWRFAVPATVLRAHSLPDRAASMLETADDAPAVREIFFLPRPLDGNICAVSRDGEGQVTCHRRVPAVNDKLPGFEDFAVYLERGVLAPYTFAGEASDCPATLSTLPVFTSTLSLPELTLRHPYADAPESERVSDSLLTLFAYNPNKASSYYEADTESAVFVETHGTLRASATTLTYEATAAGGLSVADLVHKSADTLNLRDDLIAGEMFVAELRAADAAVVGGAAVPQLSAVGRVDRDLVLDYVYTYSNVALAAEEETPALRITIRGHRIVGVSVTVATYTVTDRTPGATAQRWMRNLVAYLNESRTDAPACTVRLAYRPTDDPAVLRADWVLDYAD